MILKKVKICENKIYISKINKKSAKKVSKKIKKENIKKVVCCKEIMKNKEFINYLSSQNIFIYNGRYLYKNILKNILKYIQEQKIKIETKSAAILVNEDSTINLHIIYLISNLFKSITIITNHFRRFYKVEEELQRSGIPINISNNKKKALKKVDFIFNIDYTNELINKFRINNNAIIINMEENIKIQSKQFEGININYYEIDFENQLSEYEKFDKNIIYECLLLEGRE